ncbi:DUF4832 domain-containing protein [Hymenobacter weizhouensis]|uniref:DUF4832 domain-containing protein n=1 Tax=Hymenobacter sp. YIM 151500-1 TaxID=2987689 RepID=UPI00222716A0|nr:DUF4832 domain-containing protein [Hymenobacter sp. YIM 151500-1]UYZ63624.1 DUF4832 domain-containing protein [Hymenobacter sp. YIM 151500-1]
MKTLFPLLLLGSLVGTSLGAPPAQAQITTKTYTADNTNFPNPERGFAVSYDVAWPANTPWEFCSDITDPAAYTYTAWTRPLVDADLQRYRQQNMSVVMVRYHIAEFRYTSISPAFLDRLTQDFAAARRAGIKVIPRFVYNWPKGGPDAPVDKVLDHLEALRGVFSQNADVIASLEAGFIGCWGEWHNSKFNLLGSGGVNSNTRAIIEKIASVLPTSRMFAVRYPGHKAQYFGGSWSEPVAPVTAAEAFNGSIKSRMGAYDDCLVCGEFNWDTYSNNKAASDKIKAFLQEDNKYVAQGGEPGGMDNPSSQDLDGDGFSGSQYADCARVVPLLNRLHWSTMNWNYGERIGGNAISYTTWEKQGCLEEIQKWLGYRLRLTQAVLPTTMQAGGTLALSFDVHNDGFASPYNPRGLELIIRNKATLAHAAVIPLCDGRSKPANRAYDPRFWQSGTTTTVAMSTTLPASLPAGDYEVLVHLFDPLLYGRPEFSIRLANQNTWEAATGYNKLGHTLTVTAPSTAGLANGIYTLTARHSGRRLDVSGSSTADGAKVQQYWPNPSDAQRWQLTAVGQEGYYTLTAQCSGKKLALDTNSQTNGGFSDLTSNGVQVFQFGTDNADNRLWKVETTAEGFYTLTNKASGKCLDVAGGPGATSDGVRVLSWAYVGGTNQQWKLEASPSPAAAKITAVRTSNVPGSVTQAAAAATQSREATPLDAYPNPSLDGKATLRLVARQAQRATVQVYSEQGRLVSLLTVPLREGQTEFRLPASLPPGTYYLKTRLDGQAQSFTFKVE